MASVSLQPFETSPLLGRRSGGGPSRLRQEASCSTTTNTREEDEVDEAQSVFSHVSLDGTPTYGRLVGAHVLSMLPGLAMQLATIMLAFHAPCHIYCDSQDQRADRRACRRLLSDWMSFTAMLLGIVCWLAAYSCRPAVSKIIGWLSSLLETGTRPEGPDVEVKSDSKLWSTLFLVLLRTAALESLRMYSIMVANALLLAGLAHLQERSRPGPGQDHRRWLLHWNDPRFTIGLWVAIGWCITEFVVSTFQMMDRLSLYKPLFDQFEEQHDINIHPISTAAEPSPSLHAASHAMEPAPEYLSDSAATVRAVPSNQGNGEASKQTNGKEQKGRASPRLNLLRVSQSHDILPQGEIGGENSGFSGLDNQLEEQEMHNLRQQLDEEMEELARARMRDELQQTLGQPLTEVPIVLCALWRIDGWLWNLGSTLLMAASISLAQGPLTQPFSRLFPPFHLVCTTLYLLIALHTVFTAMWTLALPVLGFAFVTYTSMLAGLGLCVSALGRWGLLV